MAAVKLLLNEVEKGSALWKKLETHLRARLEMHRVLNDDKAGTRTELQTARLRGRIDEIKEFLALNEPETK